MNPIVIDHELELRMLAPEHAVPLFAVIDSNRAYLREWLPWLDGTRVVSDTERFIAATLLTHQETKAFVMGIWWRGKLVGVIGQNRIDWDNRIANLGYWLASDCQGHGIMTRSCRNLLQQTFNSPELNRIEICTAVGNHRSESIPTRLGFAREGIRRQGEWLHERFVDLNVFAMLRSTWALREAMQKT